MFEALERWVVLGMQKNSSWPGLRHLRPSVGQRLGGSALLETVLVYCVPTSIFLFAVTYLLASYEDRRFGLTDYAEWLPTVVALATFVLSVATMATLFAIWNRASGGGRGRTSDAQAAEPAGM